MRVLLTIIAALSLLASLGTCAIAKGAPHEIEAQVWFLIFIVSSAGAMVVDMLRKLVDEAVEANRIARERGNAAKP